MERGKRYTHLSPHCEGYNHFLSLISNLANVAVEILPFVFKGVRNLPYTSPLSVRDRPKDGEKESNDFGVGVFVLPMQ